MDFACVGPRPGRDRASEGGTLKADSPSMSDVKSGLPVGLKSISVDQTPEHLRQVAYCILQGVCCLLSHCHEVDGDLSKAPPGTSAYEMYTIVKSLRDHVHAKQTATLAANTPGISIGASAEELAMPVNVGPWLAALGLSADTSSRYVHTQTIKLPLELTFS